MTVTSVDTLNGGGLVGNEKPPVSGLISFLNQDGFIRSLDARSETNDDSENIQVRIPQRVSNGSVSAEHYGDVLWRTSAVRLTQVDIVPTTASTLKGRQTIRSVSSLLLLQIWWRGSGVRVSAFGGAA